MGWGGRGWGKLRVGKREGRGWRALRVVGGRGGGLKGNKARAIGKEGIKRPLVVMVRLASMLAFGTF